MTDLLFLAAILGKILWMNAPAVALFAVGIAATWALGILKAASGHDAEGRRLHLQSKNEL